MEWKCHNCYSTTVFLTLVAQESQLIITALLVAGVVWCSKNMVNPKAKNQKKSSRFKKKKWDLKILLREVLKLGGLDGAKEPEGARGRDGRISQALYF